MKQHSGLVSWDHQQQILGKSGHGAANNELKTRSETTHRTKAEYFQLNRCESLRDEQPVFHSHALTRWWRLRRRRREGHLSIPRGYLCLGRWEGRTKEEKNGCCRNRIKAYIFCTLSYGTEKKFWSIHKQNKNISLSKYPFSCSRYSFG